MAQPQYRTVPDESTSMPPGIPYIIGNEAAERFSYYGMRAILVVYMTGQYLVKGDYSARLYSDEAAKSIYHTFVAVNYLLPVFGAILADWLWGKYPTIIRLSIVYCLGHIVLAAWPGQQGLLIGLGLIAVGAGGIKPCVSAHVGDQFGKANSHLLPRVFSWFYFSINFGAFFSSLLTPWLLQTAPTAWGLAPEWGPHLAFGLPGLLMILATYVFYSGRNVFIHRPASGLDFWTNLVSPSGLWMLLRLIPIFLFVAIFWSLYDQTGSAWVLQADKMDLTFLGTKWLAPQVNAVNPLLIMIYVPLCDFIVFPLIQRVVDFGPLRRISTGLFLTAGAFAIAGMAQTRIDAGQTPSIAWQLLAYAVLTFAEVLVSTTCLDFAYQQAPVRMKSVVMALFLLSVTLGNTLTAYVNYSIRTADGKSAFAGANYYWLFTGIGLTAAVLFIPIAAVFKGRSVGDGE